MVQVSVIIPAYNAQDCLERAVGSVQAQTLADIEIIICDDASHDGSWALASRLAAEDPRICLLRQPVNRGPSAARNAGIAAARGEWIALLDADDAFLPDRLARLVAFAESHGLDAVADNLLLYDWAAGRVVARALPMADNTSRVLTAAEFVANALTGVSRFDLGQLKLLVRRDLARATSGFPEDLRHGEDFHFALECLLHGARLGLSGAALYLFTQRIGAASATASGVSRTVADLGAMLRATEALRLRPEVRRDAALARQIGRRARAIRWHQSWSRAYPHLRGRRPVALLAALCTDWRCLPMLALHLARRARGARAFAAGARLSLQPE